MSRTPLCHVLLFGAITSYATVPTLHAQDPISKYYRNSYAIVIGIGHYSDSTDWPSEPSTRQDAESVTVLLRKEGFHVFPLYDSKATHDAIREVIYDSIATKLKWDDRVLFFYSGHGTTRQQNAESLGYLVPYDAGSGAAMLISKSDLEDYSQAMRAAKHQLFILNACFSGSFATLGAAQGAAVEALVDTIYLDAVTGRAARQVITAGGRDQEVRATGPAGYTYFGYYLIQALNGEARDIGGFISFLELSAWVSPHATSKEQSPVIGRFPGDEGGQFLFASPLGAKRHVAIVFGPAQGTVNTLGDATPRAFSFYYNFDDPNGRGRRDWSREGDSWIERFPNGVEGRSVVADRITVDEDRGTLVRSVKNHYEYFIPDKGAKVPWLRDRLAGQQWSFLGEMHDIK